MTDRTLRLMVGGLAAGGIAVAGYLTYARYSGSTITCTSGGCETVQSSEYATVAGIPVALLGLIGYSLILVTVLSANDGARLAGAALTLTAFVFSAYLLYLQLGPIGAVCDWCVVSDAIATVLPHSRPCGFGNSPQPDPRALRWRRRGVAGQSQAKEEGEMNEQSILDTALVEHVMHKGVVTCSLYAPITAVARTMATNRIHCVVVWNEPARNEAAELWGVVSDLDLVKIAASADLSARTAGGSAATPALMVAPDETLRRAAQLMAEHEVTHLVVVDPKTARPVGVLSTLDLAGALSGAGEPATAPVSG